MRGSCSCSSHSLRRRGQPGRLALLRKPLDHVQQEDFLDLVAVRVELPVKRRYRVAGRARPTADEITRCDMAPLHAFGRGPGMPRLGPFTKAGPPGPDPAPSP